MRGSFAVVRWVGNREVQWALDEHRRVKSSKALNSLRCVHMAVGEDSQRRTSVP